MTHDSLLLLAASGKAFSVRAWKVPEASRTSSGTAIAQVGVWGWGFVLLGGGWVWVWLVRVGFVGGWLWG